MERCGARRSFEKPRVEAPPRLQVIGFNVSPLPMKAAEAAPATSRGSLDMVTSATASYNELPISPSQLSCKPAAPSPRSALQQLLLHQSLPCTSPTSSNHSLPPIKSSPNQNSSLGLLQPDISSPAAANQKRSRADLPQPSTSPPSPANRKLTSGIFNLQSPPSAYQSNSSSGYLKPVDQSELISSEISANQSSRTSFFSSLSQSQYANSSVTSGGSLMINQHNAKSGKAGFKENYEAFYRIVKKGDDGNGAKAHEVNSPWNSAKADHSHAAKSKKSSWFHDDGNDDDYYHHYDEDDHPSAAESCKKSSWKGVQPITEQSPGNEKSRKSSRSEEKSKKSSVFIMFVANSPAAPDYHYQGHSAEHNIASKSMDFLSSCHLCRRPLGHGQDIFMYSGDKAFCSMECRYQQIIIDERKERCPPPIIRSGASTEFHQTSITAKATHHPIMINKPYFINTAAAA